MNFKIRTITIEPDGDRNHVFLDRDLLGAYPTIELAQFAALLAARDINRRIRKLEFEPDELGNFIASVASQE